jgi:hypothetical protein
MIKEYTLVLTVHNVKQMIVDELGACNEDPYRMSIDTNGQLITLAGVATKLYRHSDNTFHEEPEKTLVN